jgi:hypothetical protein
MDLNPCLECARKNMNKNNPVCRDCNKRVDYVNTLESRLNFTASYGQDELPTHRISFISGDTATLTLNRDAIY